LNDSPPNQAPAPTPANIEGWVDGFRDGHITGWARDQARPGTRVTIEIWHATSKLASAQALHYRGDLEAIGKGDGKHGFNIALPHPFPAAPLTFEIRTSHGAPLPNGTLTLDHAALCAPPSGPASAIPVQITGPDQLFGLIEQCGPDILSGWASCAAYPGTRPKFEIVSQGQVLHSFEADWWRGDLAESRQGDGRWGFAAAFPQGLCTGQPQSFDLRVAGTTQSVLVTPLLVQFSAHNRPPIPLRAPDEDWERSTRLRPDRPDTPEDLFFSIIVVFHNMRREAARTLASLSRAYQRGVGDLRYEVLCVDNGSTIPLDAAFVESFGPEFRLLAPARVSKSPVFAINDAAAHAQGRYVCAMIDGAHVLTPGVFRETWDALTEAPQAIVGLRQWFVGGDQRFLAHHGYVREHEDVLFDRIAWPKDGYSLFSIGGPVYENGNAWLGSMNETNFLVVPRTIWREIGGMDERFDVPGGGFANLDLFARAVAASPEPPVALVGEASFHQFHGGTTTNVIDDEKDRLVRAYRQHYEHIARQPFGDLPNLDLRLRGQIHIDRATRSHQRPPSPLRLGITDAIRPAVLPIHFDEQAVEYLQAIYMEAGLHQQTSWRGQKIAVAPADLLALQDIFSSQLPDAVVLINTAPGLAPFFTDLAKLHGTPCRIITNSDSAAPGVTSLPGPANDSQLPVKISASLDAAERIMVIFTPDHGDRLPFETLRAYANLVSIRQYLVFAGTTQGQPWLGYSRNWFKKSAELLIKEGNFTADQIRETQILTVCAHGFLQRIGPVVSFSENIFS